LEGCSIGRHLGSPLGRSSLYLSNTLGASSEVNCREQAISLKFRLLSIRVRSGPSVS